MRRPYQILLPLLSLFLVRVDLTDLLPWRLPVKVLKIYDGDTLLIQSGSFQQKVRLSRIDAPEKGQPFLGLKGDAGAFAKNCLKKLLPENNEVTIEAIDVYGRLLGDVGDLNFKLIEAGCVSLYPHATFSSRQEKYRFLSAWMKSKREKRGIWAFGGVMQPKVWRKLNRHRH